MRTGQLVTRLLPVALLLLMVGGQRAGAQDVRVEAGGGWAIPSTTLDVIGTLEGGGDAPARLNPGPGRHAYAAAGLVWTLSDNFSLEARLRGQYSRLGVEGEDFTSRRCGGNCRLVNGAEGGLWGATVEGHLTLTSVGRIQPYFLVGLGVVQTTVDAAQVETPNTGDTIQFPEVSVTDAGGDVGFGAMMRLGGGLFVTAETRVTGSLPGAKDNAVTTFPFSLGLSYTF
jgi:opacity protein-like surface antigen